MEESGVPPNGTLVGFGFGLFLRLFLYVTVSWITFATNAVAGVDEFVERCASLALAMLSRQRPDLIV